MTHFNLNRMLQGCSAFIQTMTGDRAARNDAKRVNNHVLPLTCPLLASSLRLTCPLHLRRIALILCVLAMSVGEMWGESVTATYSHSGTSFNPVTFTTNDYFSAMTIATTGTVGGGTQTGARCNLNGNTSTTITFTYTAKSSFEVTSFKLNSFVNSNDVKNSVITYYKNSETPTELSPAITFDKSNSSPSDKSSSTISESLNNGDVFTIKVSINNSTSTARQWYINTITLYLTASPSCTPRTFKSGEKVYFKDQDSNFDFGYLWKVSSGNVYAYFWNDDESEKAWSSYGSPVEGEWNDANTIYELTVPGSGKEYTKVLFTRGNAATFDSGLWDKTTDQYPCEGKNLFYVHKEKYADHIFYGSWGNFTPADKTVYFDNRNVTDWTTAYVRIGHGSYSSAWGPMTKVAGTRNLYSQTTSKWASHTDFAIANKAGWTEGYHIDQPEKTYSNGSWSGSADKMTKQTNYQQYAIENDVYLCPKATSVLEHECQFYQVTNANSTTSSRIDENTTAMSLPEYTVTATGSHCTVTLQKCTNYESGTYTDLSSGGTVLPTQYVKVTVAPDEHYEFGSVAVTGVGTVTANAAGTPGVYYVTGDATITATCTAITHSVSAVTSTGDNSKGTVSAAATTVAETQTTTVTAVPATGYQVSNWAVSGTGSTISPSGASNATSTTLTMGTADAMVTVTFEAKSYIVTLNHQGGTNATNSLNVTYNATLSNDALFSTPTKTGYTFGGYYTEENGAGIQLIGENCKWNKSKTNYIDNNKKWIKADDVEIYAKWTPNTYSVTHTLDGVTATSGATGASAATYGTDYTAVFEATSGNTLPAAVTVTVGGSNVTANCTWDQGTGELTIPAAYVTGDIVITVTGVDDGTSFDITYNYNGGTGSPASDRGSSVDLPNPTRSGYVLQGWYTTDGTKLGDGGAEDVALTEDIVVYAKWYATCAAGGGGSTTVAAAAVNSSYDIAASIGTATKSGWSTNSSDQKNVNGEYANKLNSSGYVRLSPKTGSTFAAGDKLYVRIYNAKGETKNINVGVYNTSSEVVCVDAVSMSKDEIHEFEISLLSTYIHDGGYVEIRRGSSNGDGGWFVSARIVHSGGGGGGTCCHVTYDGNGAESGFVNDTASYASGDEVTVLGNGGRYPYVKSGYEIAGWADTKAKADAGTIDYAADATFEITADKTLYAVWRVENIALVTYTLNVGSSAGTTLKSSVDSGDDTNVPESNIDIDTSKSGISGSGAAGGGSTTSEERSAAMSIKTGANGADWSGEPTNYVVFKYKVACGKKLIPSKVSMKVSNKGGSSKDNIKYKAVMSDGYGHTLTGTYVVGSQDGTVEEFAITNTNPDVYFQGNVTLKLWAWTIAEKSGGGDGFRMGTPVQIFGVIDDQATPTATITWTKQPAGGLSGTNETVTAVSSDGSAVTITSNNGSVATVAGSTVSYVGVGSTYLIASGTDACGNTMVSVNSDNFTVIGAYNLSYDANTGTGTMTGETGVHYAVVAENNFTAPSGKVFFGWNTAANGSGDSYQPGDDIELSANTTLYAQWGTDLTATWSVTKVDDKLYRGGGGYSVTVYLDDAEWDASGDVTALELTATEGVVLSNITKTVNGEGQAQVTANFGITTGVAADATAITFTLSVPAAGTYASVDLPHNETLDDCSGSGGTVSIFDGTIDNTNTKDAIKYKQDKKWTDPTTSFASTAVGVKDPLYVFADNSWSTSNVTVSGKKYLRGIQQGGSNAAENHFKLEIPTGTTATIYFVGGNTGGAPLFGLNKSAIAPQSGTHADKVWYGEHGSSKVLRGWTIENIPSGTYYLVGNNGNCIFAEVTVTLTPLGGGGSGPVTPTLNWETDLSGGVSKKTSDDDFVHTASQDMNSLGAITYSSNNTAVATVNATTGEVHLEGAGTATITATIAASGCYNTASVSYVVTVEDDCDDVAGTITTEDLGCSGIKMTVTGHTTTASTSYQWYKVGSPDEFVGTDQDNFTTSDAGSYYVIVTNTGDRHCAKRSRNTIEVEAQSVATATKIVDRWYVKNGRRTPDVELVQTTNANGFIVKIGETEIWDSDGSETIGFGGCGFHMGENGIIYLNGTTAEDGSGDAPSGLTGDTDVTLKITAEGCGGNASELSITIHCQASTTRKSIAFVVDGTEKGTFAQANADHSTNSALYQFLDYGDDSNGAFDLTAQNIYSTTDEKAIREHFSQFDAIIITDDPNTKKNPANKSGDYYKNHGYVNAFGTMIDVRPILSMEAFVSRLTNWGSKGVAGDPSSPNPRPYEMRLQCKDHEIYTGLPSPAPGTHVWIETIDDEEYRHVVMVDKTKSPYTGLADNEKTSGEGEVPALQGFAASAMGDLLGLGVISEGALQAAIERQEEPAARMMLLGVNAKALPNALTEEGKKVIENALKYLLKTNMEEVDDCSNFFKGGDPTKPRDWNTLANWSKATFPNYETKVRILAPCEVSGIQVRVAQVDIATSGTSSKIDGGTCNGSLTIAADGALIVGGKVRTAEAPRFAANDLKPTTASDLKVCSSSTGTGALIFDNSDGKAQATIEMYSASYWETEAGKKKKYWSYVGVPIADVEIPDYFYLGFTYLYDETSGWIKKWDGSVLQPFEGIGLSMQAGHKETFRGTLASTKTKEITLTHGSSGENLIGNSWTAPIQIANFKTADFGEATATVYVYNTGRDEQASGETGEASYGGNNSATAGQWVSVPISAAKLDGYTGLKVIPAMNAFQVNTSSETTLTLDYDTLVRKNADSNAQINNPLRAPRRAASKAIDALMRVRVSGEKTHTDVWLLQDEQFSDDFDNGWEAIYAVCDNRSAQLYAVSELGQMAFIAKPDLEGTPIGFAPSRDGNLYTFSFQYTGGDTYYLNDLKEEKSTLIEAENTYLFTYEEGEMSPRFLISTTPFESPSVTTGVGNVGHSEKAQKIIYNDHVYIIRAGRVYDIVGKEVR